MTAMPLTGPVTIVGTVAPNGPLTHRWECACGAEAASIDVSDYSDPRPLTLPGELLEACTCPKCILCGWVLDGDSRCDNLNCTLVGVHIVEPD